MGLDIIKMGVILRAILSALYGWIDWIVAVLFCLSTVAITIRCGRR